MRRGLVGLLVATLACTTPPAPLATSLESPEALGRAVVARMTAGDVDGLRQLMLTREEFEAHVWPHLPASRPETNMPMSFVWNRLQQQSEGRLAQAVAHHAGRSLTVVGVATRGEASRYGVVEVLRESVVTVRTDDGTVEELALFGSIVRQGARYKVFSYVTD